MSHSSGACQAPSHQLPEQLTQAVATQVETFISFGTSDDDATYIAGQHSIESDDLSSLSRYKFFLRTHDENDDLTHSYKVNAFPPIREVRASVSGERVRTTEDVKAMKRHAVEAYGDVPETDEEIKEQSPFFDGDPEGDEDTDVSALARAAALQAIYDAGFYSEGDDFVTLDEASNRITRYLERVDVSAESPSQLEGVLGRIPETLLKRDRRGDELRVRTTAEGKMQFLSPVDEDDDEITENTGGFEHAEILREAYDEFLELDLPLQVLRQQGGDEPDARAVPDVVEYHSIVDTPGVEPGEVVRRVEKFRDEHPRLDRLTNASAVDIEAELSTGDSAPGVTNEHINRSAEAGRRCLLLAWPDTAEKIARRLDTNPRGMRSFDEDGVSRLYNANGRVKIDGVGMYRETGGQNTWLQHDTGEVELRANGETIAMFDSPADVFEDADAYPTREDEIASFDGWTEIKRPAFPPDRDMVEVIAVTDDGLRVLEDREEIPLDELGQNTRQRSSGPSPPTF